MVETTKYKIISVIKYPQRSPIILPLFNIFTHNILLIKKKE